MAIIGAVSIPSTTRKWLTIDYPWLEAGETINTLDVAVDGADAGSVLYGQEINNAEKMCRVLFGGEGVLDDGDRAVVAMTVLTSMGQKVTDHIEIIIDNGGV